jgi:methyltransferase (TIGR00027 family)
VPRCERVTVPADLREDWPAQLAAAGFGPAEPSTWLAEGLIIYLTAGEAERLLSLAGDLSVPGGRLAFEHDPAGLDTMTATARQIPAMRKYTALWKGGLGDPPRWLADHGWRPEFHGLAALGRSYRRPVPDSARSGFLTAERVATVARGSSRPEPG